MVNIDPERGLNIQVITVEGVAFATEGGMA